MRRPSRLDWPNGKAFAFSIFDDTDNASVERVRPVYQILMKHGVRITKSVWPLRSNPNDRYFAQSLQDNDYLEFILELQNGGFEIGYHGARAGSNPREVTIEALELFRDKVGHYPRTYAQHAPALENLYWGSRRTRIPVLQRFADHYSEHRRFLGDDPDSAYFWGDICKERIRYVRNFGFNSSNVLSCDPWIPYHDPSKPWVNLWFSSNAWLRADQVGQLINEKRIEQWEREGALVIMSGHLAEHFSTKSSITTFEGAVGLLAEGNGWCVPVGTVLDYICEKRGAHTLTPWQALVLELRWAIHSARKMLSSAMARTVCKLHVRR